MITRLINIVTALHKYVLIQKNAIIILVSTNKYCQSKLMRIIVIFGQFREKKIVNLLHKISNLFIY